MEQVHREFVSMRVGWNHYNNSSPIIRQLRDIAVFFYYNNFQISNEQTLRESARMEQRLADCLGPQTEKVSAIEKRNPSTDRTSRHNKRPEWRVRKRGELGRHDRDTQTIPSSWNGESGVWKLSWRRKKTTGRRRKRVAPACSSMHHVQRYKENRHNSSEDLGKKAIIVEETW